ncbi:MAG: YggS family pyridoxal phosphate-dependent enzyme [Eubacterium sp.]|nr:YggS family pyridoxal phosphate-dependent enzyme [Eubacterium sp.]
MLAYVQKNVDSLRAEIPEDVTLIAVTKYHDDTETQAVVDAGVLDLGENKVQDLMGKMERIKGDIRWHFIGHLQRNKVKYLVGKVFLIHSVHSLELLKTIEKESQKKGVITDVLLQFNLAKEDSKSGFYAEDYAEVMDLVQTLSWVRVKGLMCIGPMTKNSDKIRKIFKQLKELYDTIKTKYHGRNIEFTTLSMGMTDDYPIAIEEGATMVRIGRKIFYQ